MSFNSHSREILGRLADAIIPAGECMPSASQANIMGIWLDRVLLARPELEQPLQQLLGEADGQQASAVVAELRNGDEAAFGVLTEVVCGAYFMNPQVREAIGYSGQGPRAIDPRPDFMEDGLLESVIRRGPIYRPTPQHDQSSIR